MATAMTHKSGGVWTAAKPSGTAAAVNTLKPEEKQNHIKNGLKRPNSRNRQTAVCRDCPTCTDETGQNGKEKA